MKTSKSDLRKWMKDRQNFTSVIVWLSVVIVSLIILGILVGTHVFAISMLNGFLVSAFFSTLALYLIRVSVKELIRTENYFYYVFLFICRVGLYFIPFLLAVFIQSDSTDTKPIGADWVICVYGVLWGLAPLVIVPLSGTIPAAQVSLKNKPLSRA